MQVLSLWEVFNQFSLNPLTGQRCFKKKLTLTDILHRLDYFSGISLLAFLAVFTCDFDMITPDGSKANPLYVLSRRDSGPAGRILPVETKCWLRAVLGSLVPNHLYSVTLGAVVWPAETTSHSYHQWMFLVHEQWDGLSFVLYTASRSRSLFVGNFVRREEGVCWLPYLMGH